jgi:hypothetical protein
MVPVPSSPLQGTFFNRLASLEELEDGLVDRAVPFDS